MASSLPSNIDDLHRNLMVNNIPPSWTSPDLQALFQPFGSIESCNVVMNKQTQTSKAYGFVKFFHRTEAESALQTMNGHAVDGKTLVVKKAELGKGPSGPATLYITGFTPDSLTEQNLQEIYQQYGTIQRIKLHPPQPEKKGVAFVTFENFAEAELACNATNGQLLSNGDTLAAKFDNRTTQLMQGQTKGFALGPAMIHPQTYQHMTPFGMIAPVQRAMKTRTPMAQPMARFQPYQSPLMAKARSPIAAIATPLPNGADGNYCLFVYGVPSPQIIQQLFAPFGTVVSVRMQPGKKFGFVSMPVYAEVVNSINNLNGCTLQGGITLQVRLASETKGDAFAAETAM